MNDWLTAYNRNMAIYCIKNPYEQAKLAKNLEADRNIADSKGNWYSYFRSLIEQYQVLWGDFYMELYINARLTSSPSIKTIHIKNWVKLTPEELVSHFTQVSSARQILPVVFCTGVTIVVARTLSSSAQNRFSGTVVLCKDLCICISHQNKPNLPIRRNHPLKLLPSKGPTPIKSNRLADCFSGNGETEANYLINGISNDFSLGFVDECPGIESQISFHLSNYN